MSRNGQLLACENQGLKIKHCLQACPQWKENKGKYMKMILGSEKIDEIPQILRRYNNSEGNKL